MKKSSKRSETAKLRAQVAGLLQTVKDNQEACRMAEEAETAAHQKAADATVKLHGVTMELALLKKRKLVTREQLEVLAMAAKPNDLRPGLTGLFVEPDGRVAATDGHRLMWASPSPADAKVPSMQPPDLDAVVPKGVPVLKVAFNVGYLADIIKTWEKMVHKKDLVNPVVFEFHGPLSAAVLTLSLPGGAEVKTILMPCRLPDNK